MRKLAQCGIVLAAAAGFGLPVPARGDVITVNPEADSYVQKSVATTNFGNASTVRVRGQTADTIKAYFRFDISSIPDPQQITAATFSIAPAAGNTWSTTALTYNVYALEDGHSGENWVEGNGGTDNTPAGEITWGNAPANDTSTTGFDPSDTTLLGSFTAPTSGSSRVLFNNAALVSFLAADTNDKVTLMLSITTASTTIQSLAPRTDVVNRAALDLTIPEPSAIALTMLGGLAAFWRRGR